MIAEHILEDEISIEEMMWLAMQGGAFDWLAEEPDLYSLEDGEHVKWPPSLLKIELLNVDDEPEISTDAQSQFLRR